MGTSDLKAETTRDLVVVIPGVMGSSLVDARGREVWGLSAGTALRALWRLGDSLRDLTLPADFLDGAAPDGVTPSGLISGFHAIPGIWTPVEGYGGLVRFLSQRRFELLPDRPGAADAPPGNLMLFAYDWRLSNRYTAALLKSRVEHTLMRWRESAPERHDAKVVFICHSMGGLVARWYLDMCGGAELARALITLGTPHRGALKALEQLVNGVRKGCGPLKADLTAFARSLPSSYELLPEYACVEGRDSTLLKTTECELPELSAERVAAGMAFHEQLDRAATASYRLLPVVGIGQPTSTTARLLDDRVVALPTIEGRDLQGDGTVPRLSARPKGLDELDASIRGVGESHAALATHQAVLDQLDFTLTASSLTFRATRPCDEQTVEKQVLGVSVADVHEAGEPVDVAVRAAEAQVLEVLAVDESGSEAARELVAFDTPSEEAGWAVGAASLEHLNPGGYTLVVRAPYDPQGLEVSPVRAATLVWTEA